MGFVFPAPFAAMSNPFDPTLSAHRPDCPEGSLIARIEFADRPGPLIVQYRAPQRSGAPAAETWLANDLELGLLRTTWLGEEGGRAEEGAQLLLLEQNGASIDASHWSEAMLEYWLELRCRDFLDAEAALLQDRSTAPDPTFSGG